MKWDSRPRRQRSLVEDVVSLVLVLGTLAGLAAIVWWMYRV